MVDIRGEQKTINTYLLLREYRQNKKSPQLKELRGFIILN